MGYLRKSWGNQTEDQGHRTVLNLILKGKLRKAVQFVCDREKRAVFQPDKLAEDHTGTINETTTSGLEGKYPHEKIPYCAMLETCNETPIFISVDITEEAV